MNRWAKFLFVDINGKGCSIYIHKQALLCSLSNGKNDHYRTFIEHKFFDMSMLNRSWRYIKTELNQLYSIVT